MNYKSVIVPHSGGPEVFKVIENDLRAPSHDEARIKDPCCAGVPA